MSRSARPNPGSARIRDDVVDAFFDRTLDEGSRDWFFRALRDDLKRCEQVARTQRALSLLKQSPACPDLTTAIMHRVERRRRFLPARLRAMVRTGRFLVAASVLMGLLGVAALQRFYPGLAEWAGASRPVSRLVESGSGDAAANVSDLASGLGTVRAQAAPVAEIGRFVMQQVEPRPEPASSKRAYLAGTLSTGRLTTIKVLPSDGGSPLLVHGGSGNVVRHEPPPALIDDRIVLLPTPLGQLPSPSIRAWSWAAGLYPHEFFLLPPLEEASPSLPLSGSAPSLVDRRDASPRR